MIDFTEFTQQQKEKFKIWEKLFLEFNAHTNLISKNDEKFLHQKHVFDSLCLNLFFEKYKIKNASVLDFGTGGGFPSLPLAICFENLKITALDSKNKKIKFIEQVKRELDLKNLTPVCVRLEDFYETFDVATSRAFSEFEKAYKAVRKNVKKGGFYISFKSKNFDKEKLVLPVEKIEYKLPLKENYERFLVIRKY